MTHDELLARIELWKKNVCLIPLKPKWQTEDCKCMTCVSLSALRAVVELHKPELHQNDNVEGCVQCSSFSYRYVEYPCPTIETIEKELSNDTR